ncbi:MAG: ubiquinone/menaquinone biosynthesis C-methylase UbiE [Myxococcota bacterium]
MKTAWDYTSLADAYLKRPDYATEAIDELCALAGVSAGSDVADVGAGVAHLTLMLADRGLNVTAVEPNDAMRANGITRTASFKNVRWFEGVGEATTLEDNSYDFVTFGSSFNVTDRQEALKETKRIARPRAWFACMWNHRDLSDPIQTAIEDIIKKHVDSYDYGSRREDQTAVINASELFGDVHKLEGVVHHSQTIIDCVEAWRSHATLQRQAGDAFPAVVKDIEAMLADLKTDAIQIPYTTRIWAAQLR